MAHTRTPKPLQSQPDYTQIQRHQFNPQPCDWLNLPFVADVKVAPRKTKRSFWATPNIECYATANILGAQYAADWLQFTKQNPSWVGSGALGNIAKAMYSQENLNRSNGIPPGFWALIEKALYHASAHFDHYAMAEHSAEMTKKYLEGES